MKGGYITSAELLAAEFTLIHSLGAISEQVAKSHEAPENAAGHVLPFSRECLLPRSTEPGIEDWLTSSYGQSGRQRPCVSAANTG